MANKTHTNGYDSPSFIFHPSSFILVDEVCVTGELD